MLVYFAKEGFLIKHYVHNCQYLKDNNWLEASREKQLLVAGAVLIVPHWHQQMWLWLTCEEEESLKRKLLCHTNLPLDAGSALMPPGPQSTTRKQSAWFVFTPAFCSHSNFSWFLLWKHSAFMICRFTGCAVHCVQDAGTCFQITLSEIQTTHCHLLHTLASAAQRKSQHALIVLRHKFL